MRFQKFNLNPTKKGPLLQRNSSRQYFAKINCSICSYPFNQWIVRHWRTLIKSIFEDGGTRSTCRRSPRCPRHCTTALWWQSERTQPNIIIHQQQPSNITDTTIWCNFKKQLNSSKVLSEQTLNYKEGQASDATVYARLPALQQILPTWKMIKSWINLWISFKLVWTSFIGY